MPRTPAMNALRRVSLTCQASETDSRSRHGLDLRRAPRTSELHLHLHRWPAGLQPDVVVDHPARDHMETSHRTFIGRMGPYFARSEQEHRVIRDGRELTPGPRVATVFNRGQRNDGAGEVDERRARISRGVVSNQRRQLRPSADCSLYPSNAVI